jgi:hypothetical protein
MMAFIIVPARAEEPAKGSPHDMARQSQNPIAPLIKFPIQYNSFLQTGPKGGTKSTLLVQPVIPIKINNDWNFIARPIITLENRPPFTDSQKRNWGLANTTFEGFFVPKKKFCGWTLGLGPALQFPTNTGPDNYFGTDNWSAGPAFVAIKMKGPWVYGALLTHLWSYAGSDPHTSVTEFQPFVNYNLKKGWYLTTNPIITANWAADSSQQWTIPVGGGVGRVFKMGKYHVSFQGTVYHYSQSPRGGSDTQLQLQLQFLFPE